MTTDSSAIQLELEQRLAERGRARGASERAELETKIAALARQLGLDPDELVDITRERMTEPGQLVGEFAVARRFGEVVFLPLGLALALIVVGLEQVTVGVGIAALVLVLFLVQASRRVARIRIDPSGEFSLPGRLDPLDWSKVAQLDFAFRYPIMSRGLTRAAMETVDLTFRLADGTVVTLAHGPLWRTSPRREPIQYVHLERWLAKRARAAGMTIERGHESWSARPLRPDRRSVSS